HFLTIPDLKLRGDFFVECEYAAPTGGIWLLLEGHGTSLPFALADSAHLPGIQPKPYPAAAHNFVRLVRRGNTYTLSVNDTMVLATPGDTRDDFHQLR